jgi:cytochrome P450
MLDVYGPNVGTAPFADWQRQRKIVAAPFNENTNKLVWTESLSQTKDMLEAWTACKDAGTLGTAKDTRTLSLDVLAATGFRRSYKFRSSTDPVLEEDKDYRDALKLVLDNALFLMMASPKLLALPFMPQAFSRIGRATAQFRQYMMDMLNEESSLLSKGEPGTGTLMTSFVRALAKNEQGEKIVVKDGPPPKNGLTLEEILGNIFVINFAGHDTTANTLSFGMLLLAAFPEVQDWVAEELHEHLQDDSLESWEYDRLFPRLKRCQAVLVSHSYAFRELVAYND